MTQAFDELRSPTPPLEEAPHGLCTFAFQGRWFAIDVDLVMEVVAVDAIIRVPRSASFVIGLFSLRGNPIAAVDLGNLLGFGSARAEGAVMVVIHREDVVAAFPVDRVGEVVHPARGTITAPDAGEHPAVSGFFGDGRRVFTVLEGEFLIGRLRARTTESAR